LLFKVCQTIHLPLLIVPAKHAYSLQEVKAQFDAIISSPPLVASVAVPQSPLPT
jgi:16S rRNA G1207 methylase RsmC